MGLLRIPFSGHSEATKPLRRCVERAAHEMGVSEFFAATLMSHFLEELCHQVGQNRLVRIPGLGAFGPKVWHPRHDPDALSSAYPAFSAAVPFRNLVRATCPTNGAALDAIDDHRRHAHQSSRRNRESRMPSSTFRAFRDRIKAQARRLGFDE
jgi:hypothetical protein